MDRYRVKVKCLCVLMYIVCLPLKYAEVGTKEHAVHVYTGLHDLTVTSWLRSNTTPVMETYDLLEGDGLYSRSGLSSVTVKWSIVAFVLSPLCFGALIFCEDDFFDLVIGCLSGWLEVG